MSCPRAFEPDALPAYVAGELDEPELGTLELHLLDCADCSAALALMTDVRDALRRPPARSAWSAPWWAAAALGLLAFGGGLMTGRRAAPPSGDVLRAPAAATGALAVEQAVELEADREPGVRVRRGPTLLTCPAPPVGATEHLEGALRGPAGLAAWHSADVPSTGGRVRVAADLARAPAGSWSLELQRADAAGRLLETRRCWFELP